VARAHKGAAQHFAGSRWLPWPWIREPLGAGSDSLAAIDRSCTKLTSMLLILVSAVLWNFCRPLRPTRLILPMCDLYSTTTNQATINAQLARRHSAVRYRITVCLQALRQRWPKCISEPAQPTGRGSGDGPVLHPTRPWLESCAHWPPQSVARDSALFPAIFLLRASGLTTIIAVLILKIIGEAPDVGHNPPHAVGPVRVGRHHHHSGRNQTVVVTPVTVAASRMGRRHRPRAAHRGLRIPRERRSTRTI
jgi:hypothetical protein